MPCRTTALGELLRRRRSELGYSRTPAAELSGINASTIEAWEMGRVGKPPIHDVLRLARTLSIITAELERAVMEESSRARAIPARSGAIPILERAIGLPDRSEDDAAGASHTSPERVRASRRGQDELSVLAVMSLIALLAAFPSGLGEASDQEVTDLLAQLRGTRA